RRERAEQKLREARRRLQASGLRERSERQSVPRGDRLVVAKGLRALGTNGEKTCPRLVVELAAEDGPAVLEGLEEVLRRSLTRRPRERQPFDTVGVGILC